MPTLTVNGRKVTVDDSFLSLSPDQQNATVDEIAASFGASSGVTPGSGVVPDVAKSVGIGAAKGVIGLADIPELGARGIDWLTNKVTNAVGMGGAPRPGGQKELASPAIQAKIEEVTGQFYKPQSPEGQVAERFGTFLPAAMGGPGGIATRVATQAAAPFLLSEGAGALAEGTGYETPARIAAALVAPSAAARMVGARAPVIAKLSADDLQGAAGQTYQTYKDIPMVPRAVQQAADTAERELLAAGRRPRNAPQAWGGIDELRSLNGGSVADVRSVRQNLSQLAAETADKAERVVAQKIVRKIDDLLDTVSPELRVANANYAAGARSKDVAKALENAEINAASANSGRNIGNSIRQALKPDLKKPYGYKPDEVKQLKRVVEGAFGTNRVRDLANLLGGGGGLGQLAATVAGGSGGFAFGGPVGALAGALLPIAGRGLKGLENSLTRRELQRLDAIIRAGAPASKGQRQSVSPEVRAMLARLLLASQAAPARP